MRSVRIYPKMCHVILTNHDKICAIIETKYGDGVYSVDSGGSDIFDSIVLVRIDFKYTMSTAGVEMNGIQQKRFDFLSYTFAH